MRALCFAVLVATGLLIGCSKPPPEKGASVSCYVADQLRCEEAPAPTKAQDEARAVECSSVSGALKHPAACPTAGFEGKCTITENGATTIRRTYKGADTAYQKSFCIDTAKGAWSTTF